MVPLLCRVADAISAEGVDGNDILDVILSGDSVKERSLVERHRLLVDR